MMYIEKVTFEDLVKKLFVYGIGVNEVSSFITHKILDSEISDDIYVIKNWKLDVLIYKIENNCLVSHDKKIIDGSYLMSINKHKIYIHGNVYRVLIPDGNVKMFKTLDRAKDYARNNTIFMFNTSNGKPIFLNEKDLRVIKSALKKSGYIGLINNKINKKINRLKDERSRTNIGNSICDVNDVHSS